jgi:hypothetical protein
MLERTGTNYLRQLLLLHDETAARPPIAEDHLLHHAGHLVDYVRAVGARWSPEWGAGPDDVRTLVRALGRGLETFLVDPVPGKHVVTKTPSVANVDLFFDLFPEASLLVVVRDGRSVVESGVRSFGWRYPSAMRDWATAARRVLAFDERNRGRPGYLLLRYEDLVDDRDATLRRALGVCGLDPAAYDFTAAASMPVRGSSDLARDGAALHWEPVRVSEQFDPVRRWADWPDARHRQFARLAGGEQRALGYDLEPVRETALQRLLRR